MSTSEADSTLVNEETHSSSGRLWALLGLGGVLSLCCIAAPAMSGGSGMVAASSASNSAGGSLIRILVTAVTVGVIGLGIRLRTTTQA